MHTMHKMIHSSGKRINRRYDRLIFALNIPSITAAAVLLIISRLIIVRMSIPADLYGFYFMALYGTAAYSFAVTLAASVIAHVRSRGHEKYTYIEILGEQMVISEYVTTVYDDGEFQDLRRMWVMNLADAEEVVCTRSRMKIKGRARRFEGRAEWFDYDYTSAGKISFMHWWYDENGGETVDSVDISDKYIYAERIAQRIIFCSQKQKAREIRRAEFRQRMLEIAGRSRQERRKKRKERVFRGYEPEMERKFY